MVFTEKTKMVSVSKKKCLKNEILSGKDRRFDKKNNIFI